MRIQKRGSLLYRFQTSRIVSQKSRGSVLRQLCGNAVLLFLSQGNFLSILVTVDNPIPADDTVKDRHITNEHWITKDVIEEFGEPICDRVGRIELDPKDVRHLKVASAKNILPKQYKNESEIWQKKGGLFVLKPVIMDRVNPVSKLE